MKIKDEKQRTFDRILRKWGRETKNSCRKKAKVTDFSKSKMY